MEQAMGKTVETGKLNFTWVMDHSEPYVAQVDHVIRQFGWAPLNDQTARILCAVDEQHRVVGFHVLQLFPHVEPLWVAPDYQGTGLADDLASRMLKFMMDIGARGFMVVADSPHAVKLCEKYGMKRVASPVYVL